MRRWFKILLSWWGFEMGGCSPGRSRYGCIRVDVLQGSIKNYCTNGAPATSTTSAGGCLPWPVWKSQPSPLVGSKNQP